MIVQITAEAEADLEHIADYIAQDNPIRALSFVQELRDKGLDLSEMPLAFPLVPRYEHHRVRRRAYRDYLIFYRASGDCVVIYHVLHGAMDYAAILFPD